MSWENCRRTLMRTSMIAPVAAATLAAAFGAMAANNSSLDRHDEHFMKEAAGDGLAEVQLGQLAKDRGMSDEVKSFANRMVDDHSKANEQLKSLAQAKGVQLPTE